MTMVEEMIISGFISKIASDIVDIPLNQFKNAIKDADKNRRDKNQSIETRIYQVTIDAIKEFTKKEYRRQDVLYDAAESILKGLIRNRDDKVEAVREGIKMLVSQVTSETCEDFLWTLCYAICKKENRDLAVEVIILQQEQTNGYIQEGFRRTYLNDEEINQKLDYLIKELNDKKTHKERYISEVPIINRADEYAKRWNENVFLNNFNEEDENAGVNIKLREIYKEECLPHYIWGPNKRSSDKLRKYLMKFINNNSEKKMLLILGQPGIGKSTLITWIMANLVEKQDDILVYQFASDLESISWQCENVLNNIFKVIGLEYDELENKTLILDGFDEIYAGRERERILNKLDQELKRKNILKKFSLIITCRENYVNKLKLGDIEYITLQTWNEGQIKKFCDFYKEVIIRKKSEWRENKNMEIKINKIIEKKDIMGIPLILYMVLALNVDFERGSSIVDIYDQIFSLKGGGIYDRGYDVEHRINEPETKGHIHHISQRIAFWMFENNAHEATISQENFEVICENEMIKSGKKGEEIQSDTLIGNFFRLKYCEGKGTDELQFVHRSIYEYFVVIYFFESIHKLKSEEEVAGKLGELLKEGHLTMQILEFIKCKFNGMKCYNLGNFIKRIFNEMLRHGMTYCTKAEDLENNVIQRERNIFSNMLEVVHLWNPSLEKLDKRIIIYLQCNRTERLNLSGIQLDFVNIDRERATYLSRVYLRGADLRGANLIGTNLSGTDLSEADLRGADLIGADLSGADLSGADLSEADLRGADLSEAKLNGAILGRVYLDETGLSGTIFDEKQVNILREKYDLSRSRVVLSKEDGIISCKEYCIRKQQD